MFSIVGEINGGAARCQLGRPAGFTAEAYVAATDNRASQSAKTAARYSGSYNDRARSIVPCLDAMARALRLIAQ